jgi:hypothetical protein
VFRRATQWLFDWSPPAAAEHAARVAFFAWPVLGALYAVLRPSAAERVAESTLGLVTGAVRLNRLDALVVLGAMNALFALFVLVQLRALFGGQAYLMETVGLTVAEYARAGFFALVVAVGLVLGVLLAIDALLDPDAIGAWPTARRLATVLLALLAAVLVSALARMGLYVSAFGLSVDRVLALAVIGALGAILVLYAVTVLRGRPAWFTSGAIAAGVLALLTLNVADPDTLVARSQVRRAAAGASADVDYVARALGPGAVPTLVEALAAGRFANLPAAADTTSRGPVPHGTPACRLAGSLLRWAGGATAGAGRTLDEMRAVRAVRRHAPALRAAASECPSTRAGR